MSNIIIGTAGHIDHGKTALIRALNGFEGDSTNEEKQRGITIDLSFSNLTRAERNIAFIDVPGHEKLIKNMIAGAFGFDYVMLVVSAKEGLMPQTIEHIEILSLLGIKNLIERDNLWAKEYIGSHAIPGSTSHSILDTLAKKGNKWAQDQLDTLNPKIDLEMPNALSTVSSSAYLALSRAGYF